MLVLIFLTICLTDDYVQRAYVVDYYRIRGLKTGMIGYNDVSFEFTIVTGIEIISLIHLVYLLTVEI